MKFIQGSIEQISKCCRYATLHVMIYNDQTVLYEIFSNNHFFLTSTSSSYIFHGQFGNILNALVPVISVCSVSYWVKPYIFRRRMLRWSTLLLYRDFFYVVWKEKSTFHTAWLSNSTQAHCNFLKVKKCHFLNKNGIYMALI